MKTRIIVAVAVLCLFLATAFGCGGKDSAISPANNCELASKRAQTISTTLQAYAADPTPAKCQDLKKAYTDYLNAAKNCTTIARADIDDAQKEVDMLCL